MYAAVLSLVFLGGHLHFRQVAGRPRRYVMGAAGALCCATLPAIALVNDINGMHAAQLEYLHSAFSALFVVAAVTWALVAYTCVRLMRSTFTWRERLAFYALHILLAAVIILGVMATA